jgi:hypothetical protein
MNDSTAYRRFEVLLPLLFNDGQPVPQEHFTATLAELRQRFGDMSIETQATRGLAQYGGQEFRDDLIRVYVDVPDQPEHRAFFRGWKETLKKRFQQLDVWLTTFPLEVL